MADGLLSSGLNWIDQQKQALKARFGLLADNPEEFARQMAAEARQRAGVGLIGEPKTAQEMASGAWINSPYGMQAMQAGSGFAGSTIGSGLQKIRMEAKNLSEKQFLDKYVTQSMPEHWGLKELPEGILSQKPHDFLPTSFLEPSEWTSWSEMVRPESITGKPLTKTLEKVQNFRDAMKRGDVFPPVLIHTRKGEFPYVEDGHHRVAAYIGEGKKTIPVSFDIDSLIKIWKEENKSPKKVSEIYQEYKKTLMK